MKATLSFGVEVSSLQKATALRDKAAAWLEEDPDVSVFNQTMSPISRQFTVVGVDVAGQVPFVEVTEAQDEDDAKAQVIGKSKTKVVAEVR